MTITYSIAPNPHWVIIDNFSKLPPGAAIYTYSSLNKSQFKPAFQDASGNNPFTQPIVGFANGTFPPIFWQFDDSNPTDLYYIQVWDGVGGPGSSAVMLWDFDGLTGAGTGGGGSITMIEDVQNRVINGEFYRNVGDLPILPATSLPLLITLAPSNNAGYVGNALNANGSPAPHIIFAKSDQLATDSLKFVNFVPGDVLPGNNPIPPQYVRYTSNNSGSELYKYIQFPIAKSVLALGGQTISVSMFNRYRSGNTMLFLQLRQFFGDGPGASPDILTPLGTLAPLLTNIWTISEFDSIPIPAIPGASVIGACGNDATFLQLVFPASVAFDIDFILPSLYLSCNTPDSDYQTFDFVDSIISLPITGDMRISLSTFLPGWAIMNDGTIGDVLSNATTRANIDTFPLFDLIWRTFVGNPTLAPLFTSGGVPIAYGATAIADFTAHRQISLTKSAGRILANIGTPSTNSVPVTGGSNTGTAWAIGQSTGNETTYASWK